MPITGSSLLVLPEETVSLIPVAGGALLCDAAGVTRRAGLEEARRIFRS